jgi:type IV secretion system protein VirD4
MYALSRLLLMLAVSSAAVLVGSLAYVGWPTTGVVVAFVLVVMFVRRGPKWLTTLGSARFASEDEMRRGHMIGAEPGLIVGRLPLGRRSLAVRTRRLFDRRVGAKEACRQFWQAQSGGRHDLVRLPNLCHFAAFLPTGGGKGTSLIVPWLLSQPDSCVVVDLKGENALLTAKHRQRRFGHRVVILDPYTVTKQQKPDTFNPLDGIDKNDPLAIDLCNSLAQVTIGKSPNAVDPHWDASCENFVAAMLATVVQYGDRGESRSLQTVREFLSHPQKLDLAVKAMCESDCWNGMLARIGAQLTHYEGKERASVLTTCTRHLRFLDTLAVAESTRTSSFDPAELRSGKMSIYLVLPAEHFRVQTPLLRIWITSLLRAVVAGGLQEKNKVHFILDEAASLGHMEPIEDAVDKYRGYGVRLQFYFQSLGQVQKCFPDGQHQVLLSNCVQCYAAVNDNDTADFVSSRLGDSTVVVDSGGRSYGGSSQWSEGTQPTTGGGSNYGSNANWGQQARKLLTKDEVLSLPPRTAITFVPGMRPIMTTLLRYYEEKPSLWRRPGLIRRALDAGIASPRRTAVQQQPSAGRSGLSSVNLSERRVTSMKEIAKQMFDAALAIAPGLKNLGPEVGAELKRLGTQGGMELASALFNGDGFVPYGPGQYTPSPEHGPDLAPLHSQAVGQDHAMKQSHEHQCAMEHELGREM